MKAIIYTTFFFLLLSCKNDNDVKQVEEEINHEQMSTLKVDCPDYMFKNKANNLNVSILLDLSDRIDELKYPNPTMEYVNRDLGNINTIASNFIQHVQQKKIVLMNDEIQIYFEPEPQDQTINQKSKELRVSFSKNISKESIEKARQNYKKIPKEIYQLAKKEGKYLGSDTWRFFKDKVKRYCIDTCHRNILIIFTDGYMYHEHTKIKEANKRSYITPSVIRNLGLNKSDWKHRIEAKNIGFLPATDQLNDLEVLVIGLENHDKKNPYGQDVLHFFWKAWLEDMGVKKYEIYGADLPIHMEKTISSFILK